MSRPAWSLYAYQLIEPDEQLDLFACQEVRVHLVTRQLELGGNDGLRGQLPAQLKQNLAGMIDASQQAGAKVLLLGMQLPPNYGERYTRAFAAVYAELGQEKKVALVPFFLEGAGGKPELMQADGIHPAVGAQGLLLDNVWPALKPLL